MLRRSEEKNSLKKKKSHYSNEHRLLQLLLETIPFPGHNTREFTIEFDKILVDTSFLYYSSPSD